MTACYRCTASTRVWYVEDCVNSATVWDYWTSGTNSAVSYLLDDPKRHAASARAEALLASYLTDAQRAELAARGHFTVQGSAGGEYQISGGATVRRVEHSREVESLCCHPNLAYPAGDRMLAQKLWLEADELTFCQIANRTPLIKEVRELCEDAA